jgi:hypothetical protein
MLCSFIAGADPKVTYPFYEDRGLKSSSSETQILVFSWNSSLVFLQNSFCVPQNNALSLNCWALPPLQVHCCN